MWFGLFRSWGGCKLVISCINIHIVGVQTYKFIIAKFVNCLWLKNGCEHKSFCPFFGYLVFHYLKHCDTRICLQIKKWMNEWNVGYWLIFITSKKSLQCQFMSSSVVMWMFLKHSSLCNIMRFKPLLFHLRKAISDKLDEILDNELKILGKMKVHCMWHLRGHTATAWVPYNSSNQASPGFSTTVFVFGPNTHPHKQNTSANLMMAWTG